MDNINDIINNLSSDDMAQLQQMAQNIFGGDKKPVQSPEKNEPASDLPSLDLPSLDLPNIDLSQIQALMGTVKGDDDRTRLITALRPMLSPSRQKKADEALKLLKLFRLLPVIQNSGLLKGFLEDI